MTDTTSDPLDDLEPLEEPENIKAAMYKTVDMFAAIIGRNIWLKNGPRTCTDGHQITVRMDDPNAYQKTEHEIAHLLFESNLPGKLKFLQDYTNKVWLVAKKLGVSLDAAKLVEHLDLVISVLEDHRVNSLWGRLYPGSYTLMYDQRQASILPYIQQCHTSLTILMVTLEAKLEPEDGAYSRLIPPIQTALRKVQHKGFGATLVLAKWLVMRLVDEIIKASLEEEAKAAFKEGDGSAQERADALYQMQKMMSSAPGSVKEDLDDLQPAKYPSSIQKERGHALAEQALHLHPEDIEEYIEASSVTMDQIIRKAQEALQKQVSVEASLRKNAMAKIIFQDVTDSDLDPNILTPQKAREKMDIAIDRLASRGRKLQITGKFPVEQVLEREMQDRNTVRRLRTIFNKVMGRRRTRLEDVGTEIDPQAWIERKLTGHHIPCFKATDRGRGFDALILLDRSSSMEGGKTKQVERACRIIARALRYPFVNLTIWGFQSTENGQVTISRYDPHMEFFHVKASQVGGATPLHVAIRVAKRQLDQGTSTKQMFVLTDGFPCYSLKGGFSVATTQLLAWTREEVRHCRRKGINVTCAMIEESNDLYDTIKPKHMSMMFGHSSNWRNIDPSRLGDDLVSLVSASFIRYLKYA